MQRTLKVYFDEGMLERSKVRKGWARTDSGASGYLICSRAPVFHAQFMSVCFQGWTSCSVQNREKTGPAKRGSFYFYKDKGHRNERRLNRLCS